MSWTAPRTWTTGELVTASIGDTHWRDNLRALGGGRGWIPPGAFNLPSSNGAERVLNHGTNFSYYTLAFDTSTEEHADFLMPVTAEYVTGNFLWRFYWTATGGSGTVSWEVNYGSPNNANALDASLVDVGSATDTLLSANQVHIITVAQSGTLPTVSELSTVRISRDVAADTLGQDALLLGVQLDMGFP